MRGPAHRHVEPLALGLPPAWPRRQQLLERGWRPASPVAAGAAPARCNHSQLREGRGAEHCCCGAALGEGRETAPAVVECKDQGLAVTGKICKK